MGRKLLSLVFAAMTLASAPLIAAQNAAQANGSITGVVIDASGAPVAGATVSIESKGKPARTTETSVDGRFTVEDAAAEGTLRVKANGFAELVAPLNPSEPSLRVVLQPRPLTESVTVTASPHIQARRVIRSTVDQE